MARRRRQCCGCGYVATTGIAVSLLALCAVAANLYVLRPAARVPPERPHEAVQEVQERPAEERHVEAVRQERQEGLSLAFGLRLNEMHDILPRGSSWSRSAGAREHVSRLYDLVRGAPG